jgi:hypothetical protein
MIELSSRPILVINFEALSSTWVARQHLNEVFLSKRLVLGYLLKCELLDNLLIKETACLFHGCCHSGFN